MALMTKDGIPVWKKQYEQQKRYDAENTVRIGFKLNKTTDSDIIKALDASGNKQKLVKDAIRFYLAHMGEENHD